MSTVPNDPVRENAPVGVAEAAEPEAANTAVHLTSRLHAGMGDHPLWPAFMAELKASRDADIAEQVRLADLELDAQEPPRVETRGSEVPSVQATRKREAGG